jgi:hypothetical protein
MARAAQPASSVTAFNLVMVLLLALAGCGDRAPSCRDALGKAAGTPGADGSRFLEEMTAVCERTGWTAEQRRCVANAQDWRAVGMCVAGAGEEQAQNEAWKQARARADLALARMEKARKELEDLDDRLKKSESALRAAKNDAERAAADAQLAAVRKAKIELVARVATEAEEAARATEHAIEGAAR